MVTGLGSSKSDQLLLRNYENIWKQLKDAVRVEYLEWNILVVSKLIIRLKTSPNWYQTTFPITFSYLVANVSDILSNPSKMFEQS